MIPGFADGFADDYPLVNVYIAMEKHYFYWVKPI